MVVEQIRALHAAGQDLRHGEVQQLNPRLTSAAVRYFGSWKHAATVAGIDYEQVEKRSERARIEKITKWSNERILERIRELAAMGEDLRSIIIRNKYPSLFSATTSRRYFGSWGLAVKEAGVNYESIKGRRRKRRGAPRGGWQRELILEAIMDVLPSPDISARRARRLHPDLYEEAVKGFGSWKAARATALKDPRKDDPAG